MIGQTEIKVYSSDCYLNIKVLPLSEAVPKLEECICKFFPFLLSSFVILMSFSKNSLLSDVCLSLC